MHHATTVIGMLGLVVACLASACSSALAVQPPELSEVVLADSFDNPATSYIQGEELGPARFAHEDGQLVIEAFGLPPSSNVSVDLHADARDGSIQVLASLVSGTADQYVAVGCRGSLNTYDAGYTFMVSPVDGYVGLYRREAGVELFVDGAYLDLSAFLPTGMDRIGLTCDGATVTGQINDVDVLAIRDTMHAEGYFYLQVGTFDTGGSSPSARVDDLVVSLPGHEVERQRLRSKSASAAIESVAVEASTGPSVVKPQHGVLMLDGSAGTFPMWSTGFEVQDFYATARFQSPNDGTTHPWDAVVEFGPLGWMGVGYRVAVSSAGFWEVMDPTGAFLAKGTVPNFDRAAGSPITIEVAATNGVAGVRFNGTAATQFELAASPAAGEVLIGAGMLPGNNRAGEAIHYDTLQVWALGTERPALFRYGRNPCKGAARNTCAAVPRSWLANAGDKHPSVRPAGQPGE